MNLFDAFERTAQRVSSRPAIWEASGQWTYAEAMAAVLERAGSLPGNTQGFGMVLKLPKSANLVFWQLAASRLGSVFVPLDPMLPAPRQALIVERTQPCWQITETDVEPTGEGWSLHGRIGGSCVWQRLAGRRYAPSVSHIYFSSGSSGQPKAILLPAEPLVQVVKQQASALGLTESSRFGWLLQASFDASLSDCYQTLLRGAALHLSPVPLTQRKGVQWFLQEQAITHTDIPPSMLALFDPSAFPALQSLIFGGELARETDVRKWALAGKSLFNAYGPTETTICSSLKEVNREWDNTNIGQALEGVRYAVQTAQALELAQPGLSGELVILGEHLAFGYDDPALTDQRFRESPLGRGFWTGDAVVVDGTGDLHFIGRIDRQLKRNGVLICPEEIERAAYEAGCVEARVQLDADKLLLHFSGDVDDFCLQKLLQTQLPRAFWPQKWVRWTRLPKNHNGKIAHDPSTTA